MWKRSLLNGYQYSQGQTRNFSSLTKSKKILGKKVKRGPCVRSWTHSQECGAQQATPQAFYANRIPLRAYICARLCASARICDCNPLESLAAKKLWKFVASTDRISRESPWFRAPRTVAFLCKSSIVLPRRYPSIRYNACTVNFK